MNPDVDAIANLLDGSLVGLPLYRALRERFPRTRRDDVYLAISIAFTLKEADLMIFEKSRETTV